MDDVETMARSRVGQYIRGLHPYTFRSGQWAAITNAVWDPARQRYHWVLLWPDGQGDEWPVIDPAAEYEFRKDTMSTLDQDREAIARQLFLVDNSNSPNPEREWDEASPLQREYAYDITDKVILPRLKEAWDAGMLARKLVEQGIRPAAGNPYEEAR